MIEMPDILDGNHKFGENVSKLKANPARPVNYTFITTHNLSAQIQGVQIVIFK
jgi:hypothetical protein